MSNLQSFAEEQVEDHEGLVGIVWERGCMTSSGPGRSNIEQNGWSKTFSMEELSQRLSVQLEAALSACIKSTFGAQTFSSPSQNHDSNRTDATTGTCSILYALAIVLMLPSTYSAASPRNETCANTASKTCMYVSHARSYHSMRNKFPAHPVDIVFYMSTKHPPFTQHLFAITSTGCGRAARWLPAASAV